MNIMDLRKILIEDRIKIISIMGENHIIMATHQMKDNGIGEPLNIRILIENNHPWGGGVYCMTPRRLWQGEYNNYYSSKPQRLRFYNPPANTYSDPVQNIFAQLNEETQPNVDGTHFLDRRWEVPTQEGDYGEREGATQEKDTKKREN